MATSFPSSGPIPQRADTGSKRGPWIVLLIAIGLFAAFGLWECGSVLYKTFHSGWVEATASAHHLHEEMNAGEFERIYQEADPAFDTPEKHDNFVKFLGEVHTKLGNATSEKLTNLNLNVNNQGHFVAAVFSSTFENGTARERIVWRRDGNALRLWQYNVNSDVFNNQ